MFYAHFVLAKKGPLARIWLAAHWDKKLTKAHVYETNIESSVEGIMQPKVKMALRTSGHLLLGVVRIYSRKAKYLLADCNEAFVKIKMAFRPGMVDLPEDKREAAMNAITLPDVFHDFDTAMPDLDDVDIDAQFTMNQTRAEEITMREDYGNITLTTGDDGFGDSMDNLDLEPRSPEMLRDATQNENFGTLGGEDINLDEESAKREMSAMEASTSSGVKHAQNPDTLEAPIKDDGFGGVGLVNDILSGGLFEGGSLFDDPIPGGAESIRAPPSERTGFDDDDFPSAPSPIHSDGSRPATPLGDVEPLAAPELEQTPVPPSPAHSSHSLPQPGPHEQTTLLHNEEESFALAPVEASALKGERRKRKRKLIVDEVKAITGEGMKAQLSDSADIVTTLDIAPPTKRLMHWKETGGVEELFNFPGRRIKARLIIADYQMNLKHKSAADELFDTLPGNENEDEMRLEHVGRGREGYYDGDSEEDEEIEKPKKRALKRKAIEPPEKSAYQKRQEELAKQQEEFAEEQKKLRKSRGNISYAEAPDEEQEEQERLRDTQPQENLQEQQVDISLPQQELCAENRSTNVPEGFQNSGFEQAAQSFGQVGLASPNATAFEAPSLGFPTPMHEPSFATPLHASSGSFSAQGPPATNLTPVDQQNFTEQWVNQVQTNPAMLSPPHQTPLTSPTHQPQVNPLPDENELLSPKTGEPKEKTHLPSPAKTDYQDNAGNAMHISPDKNQTHVQNGDVQEEGEEEEEEENEYDQEYPKEKKGDEDDMQEDETIEEFEDRVLNKRASQLHRVLSRKFPDNFSILTRKNTKKQAAQKFHSLLVLQKMTVIDLIQDSEPTFSEIRLKKGPAFVKGNKSL